jgi:LAGLIDADG DNA endonuclease family/Cytochrome C oxidase subunit II, transmembrane domain
MQSLIKNYFNSFFKTYQYNATNNFMSNLYSGNYTECEECCCGGSCNCSSGQRTGKFNDLTTKKWADVPLAWGLYFQDGASPSFEGIVDLHNRIMFYLVVILFGVSWIMLSIIWNFNKSQNKLVYRYLNHGTLIELIWTVGPALVLVAIAFPSFKLLYLMDEVIDPAMTVKVTGFFLNTYKTFYKYLNIGGLKSYIFCTNKSNFHTLVKARNRIGPHNKDVISVIIGSLLGNSYGSKRFVEGTKFCFRQSNKHKEYLFWLYKFFHSRGYCSNLEPWIYTRKLKHNNVIKKYYGYEFNTFTFRSFDWIYKMFYKDGKKRIHSNISNYLTPLALAIWIMDDGNWVKSGVRISCNAFNLYEVKLLFEALKQNFGLSCNIQNISNTNQYSIYIQSKSIIKLRELISPLIHNSMLYKLGM